MSRVTKLSPPANLIVGDRCNVRRIGAAMLRVVTFAGKERRSDGVWCVWRWRAEQPTPEGRIDCGYSGIRVSERA